MGPQTGERGDSYITVGNPLDRILSSLLLCPLFFLFCFSVVLVLAKAVTYFRTDS